MSTQNVPGSSSDNSARSAELVRLIKAGDNLAHLVHSNHGDRCERLAAKDGRSIDYWCTACAARLTWEQAKRRIDGQEISGEFDGS